MLPKSFSQGKLYKMSKPWTECGRRRPQPRLRSQHARVEQVAAVGGA